jgi:hypothetical protein
MRLQGNDEPSILVYDRVEPFAKGLHDCPVVIVFVEMRTEKEVNVHIRRGKGEKFLLNDVSERYVKHQRVVGLIQQVKAEVWQTEMPRSSYSDETAFQSEKRPQYFVQQ